MSLFIKHVFYRYMYSRDAVTRYGQCIKESITFKIGCEINTNF